MGLFVGVFMSAVGLGYFIYGRKTSEFYFLVAGLILMIYPYFLKDVVVIGIIGLVLILAPFLLKRFNP